MRARKSEEAFHERCSREREFARFTVDPSRLASALEFGYPEERKMAANPEAHWPNPCRSLQTQ